MKNLNYVASLVQMDMQDYTTHNRMRILQYCIDCYKGVLRYKTDKSIDVAYLTPNAVLNAPWPKDYEYYTKMAMNIGGRLVTLTVNKDIPLVREYDCGEEKLSQPVAGWEKINPDLYTAGLLYAPHYRAGQYVGEMYSLGGGFNDLGYFRVDHKMRQFQFANIPNTTIICEYVADSKTNGNTLIRYADVAPIRTYVHWQLAEFDKRAPLAIKQAKAGLHNAAMATRIHIEFGPTVSDYMDNAYKGITSGPKR
jgi:hypothetical protein